jgi:Fungal rhodopsin domain
VATLLVILRMAIRLKIMTRLNMEDFWIFLALATLLTTCILQTIQLPNLYYMLATIAGTIPISSELITAVEAYLKYEFPINILFWTVLWSIKASFLALYFKLFQELKWYRRTWYVLATVTLIAYAGCWITLSTSCHPITNFFKFEQCNTDKDIWASRFSIYYSTAIDIFTDLCSKCSCELTLGWC